MSQSPPNEGQSIEPIFISVKEAARVLNLSPWVVYQLLDDKKIQASYHGRRRLVSVKSVREYAESLPNVPPKASA